MPSPKIVCNILKTMRSIPGWPSLRVLDLSCGDGALLEALSEDGCKAEGTHFRKNDYIFKKPRPVLSSTTIHQGIDLTQRLPFSSAEYDVVIATEVMEHLPSHVLLYSEISRILKDGGHVILSTPNIHRLRSRIKFALTGQHELRSARLGWDVPASDLYSTHYNPVYLPVMHVLLHHNAIHIQKMMFTECDLTAFLMLPLYPLIYITTTLEARHVKKRSKIGGNNLLRWMLDIRAMLSDQLMFLAKKDLALCSDCSLKTDD